LQLSELSDLAAESDEGKAGGGESGEVPSWNKGEFNLWAIIKETGVDDDGLLDFHDRYFGYDTYRDENLAVYEAMGNRSIFRLRSWNPFRWYSAMKGMASRLKAKKIATNYVGEGTVQGGVLVFDKEGNLAYAYEEKIGNELELDVLVAATRALKEGGGEDQEGGKASDEL